MGKVLTKIEKLDGKYPGLATTAKTQFDQGTSAKKVSVLLNKKFPVGVLPSTVSTYRTKRWVPEKQGTQKRLEAARAIWDFLGGSEGLDILLFAQLFELINTLEDVKQVVAVKEHLLKCRAQELKEKEFLFKTGQMEPPEDQRTEEEDAAALEEKTKRVVRKIKAIFGITQAPYVRQPPPAVPSEVAAKGA